MAKFSGTIEEIAPESWRAGGFLVTNSANRSFDTVCKPRVFANPEAGEVWLKGWALNHNAAEVEVLVTRLGEPPAA